MDARSAVIHMREILHSVANIAKQYDELTASEIKKAAENGERAQKSYAEKAAAADSQLQQLRDIVNPAKQRWGGWYSSIEAQLDEDAALDIEPFLDEARTAREYLDKCASAYPWTPSYTRLNIVFFVLCIPEALLLLVLPNTVADANVEILVVLLLLIWAFIVGGAMIPHYLARSKSIRLFKESIALVAGSEAYGKAIRERLLSEGKVNLDALLASIAREKETRLSSSRKSATQQLDQQRAMLADLPDLGYMTLEWTDSRWNAWHPAEQAAAGMRIGAFAAPLLASVPIAAPALVRCPGIQNMLIEAGGPDKERAARAVQSAMLRLLATIPPGKVEFVLLDPAGLGQNVAQFLALADYDRDLIASRAWSEPEHIERQLADLSEHMETVIQGKLQGKYQSIEEYNEQAGETAQAYRFLVVIGFPQNFSDTSASRLVRIAANGPRCGVYTLIVMDTEKKPPYGFNENDLRRTSAVIEWNGSRFVWKEEGFEDWQLTLDSPPDAALFERILNMVGAQAKDAKRVEVPFERIAIAEEHWWKGDSRSELSVALGRVGARKNQQLVLNSQDQVHALVAGQTGFGKSTLFHVMITHLCLAYSPKELELYLIDFKKGVEFKPYAEHHLPHARVIAIDSEREFGLSVLRGLDAEFKRRGDAFRSTIEQNIAGYRKAHPSEVCPRIVLIVDEFQEFFTEDDAIAREAGLLLDRLVRQGRNVGVHVILGSQTLTNAGQLAHSTISQIAIRIALHCSEADSRLILAEDNPGARLLNRPGEAIYNTAGGRKGAEDQFQTVWLSSEAREYYLGRIEQLASEEPSRPQRVFEGNALAEINEEALVAMARDTAAKRAPKGAVLIWLGEAIAVQEDPIAARFRRQSGANLLLVGQQEDAALGMLTVALAGLVAQLPPVRAESGWQHPVLILDFSGGDGTHAGYYADLSDRWAGRVRRVTRRQVPEVLDALAGEVQRRIDADDDAGSGTQGAVSVFVVLHGLQRARDLRQDDSYGLSAFGTEPAAPNTGQQFAAILRDGPDVRVHTIAWCDTMTNLNRTLDRRVLREFAIRVVMQMSTEDSANLIDSPAASKLGAYRALLYNEEEGTLEKFHPYGIPSAQWLSEVGRHFV